MTAGLHYVNFGMRRYGLHVIYPFARRGWEVQAILLGQCDLLLPSGRRETAHGGSIYFFPPGCVHGWGGKPESFCEIAVFHLDRLPAAFEGLIEGHEAFERRSLESEDGARLLQLAKKGKSASEFTELEWLALSQMTVWELMALLVRRTDRQTQPLLGAKRRLEESLAWFREHLHLGVGVAEVAGAAGFSEVHYRRIFREITGEMPQRVLARIRLDRAKSLIQANELSLEDVGLAVGYSCGAAFSRAFKDQTGLPPAAWRQMNKRGPTQTH